MKNIVESFDIKLYDVFEAKTRFRDSAAFRVSIDATDVEKFINDSMWPAHVIVREWVLKDKRPPDNESN